MSPWSLLIFRCIVTVYLISMMLISAIERNTWKWLVFMTSWNYITVTLYFVLGCIVIFHAIYKEGNNRCKSILPGSKINKVGLGTFESNRDLISASNTAVDSLTEESPKLPWFYQFVWIHYNLALNICTLTFVMYWAVLHNYKKSYDPKSLFFTIDRHGVSFILLFIDFLLSRVPIRLLHFIYAEILALLYLAFNIAYWLIRKDIIYKHLDYSNKPVKAAVTVVSTFFAIFLCQVFVYCLYYVRTAFSIWYQERKYKQQLDIMEKNDIELRFHRPIESLTV